MATELFIIEIRARGAGKVARNIRRINTAAVALRKTLAVMRAALVAFAAIRLFSGVITVIAEFGDAMSRIRAITNATGLEFTALRDRAREMGRTTRFTATEAAQGMLELSKAGFNTAKVLASIDDVLDFATVGQIELADAAQITAGTLEGFGLEISQVQRVVDTLTAAAHSSLASIQDMGTAMKLISPFASKLGVNLEKTAAIMAILAKRGIKGTLAATSFRRVLANLENPGGAFAQILEDLNINTKRLRPSIVGVSEAFKVLSDAELGASAAGELFGLRGAVAFSILGDLSQAIDDTADAFGKMEGATKKAAKIITDELLNDLLLVKAAFEDLLIGIGRSGFTDFNRSIAQGVIKGLNAINANIEGIKKAIKTLLVSYAIWIALNGTLVKSLDAISFALRRMFIAMLLNPFTATAIALTSLITAFALFGDEIVTQKETGETFGDVWDANAKILGGVALEALNQFGFEFEDFGAIVSSVAKHVGNVFSLMVGVINAGWVLMNKVFDLGKLMWVGTTKLMVESMNFFAEAYNATFGKLGAEPLKIIDTSEIDKDLAALTNSVLSTFEDLENAVKAPFRAAKELAAARRTAELPFAGADPRGRFTGRPKIKDPKAEFGISPPKGDEIAKAAALTARLTDALRDLEAQFFPVEAAAKVYLDALDIINEAVDDGIELMVDEQELLKRVVRANLGLPPTLKEVKEAYKAIRLERANGNIDMEEEILLIEKRKLAHLNAQKDIGSGIQRFFLKRKMEAEDAATQIEAVMTNAFQGAEDALHDFVTTGKADFSSLVDSIISDLARMAIKMATNSIFQSLMGGSLSAPGGITGQTNGAQTIFDSIGSGNFLETLSSTLFSAAHGGSFRVGSGSSIGTLPGVDNRLVAFKARDGEEVSVTKKSDVSGAAGGNVTYINFNVKSDNADSFLRSSSQIQNKLMFGAQSAMRRR